MAKPVQIGARLFPSRKAATEYVRALRDRYKDGEKIVGHDDTFLRDLINLHSEYHEKVDVGIVYFTVGKDGKWGTTRCFYLVRRNGSRTDFSFMNCINGKNVEQDVIDGFRSAVAEQVIVFKGREFAIHAEICCPIDGSLLTKDSCDVDHVPPQTFMTLLDMWLKENNLTLLEVDLVPNDDNQWARTLREQGVILSWQAFHAAYAKLRIISKNANRSRKAGSGNSRGSTKF